MDGQMGSCPEWYVTVQAAKYLGVAPWELLRQPMYWTEWAIHAHQAEAHAQKAQQEREQRKSRKR